jgi:acyl-CoA reductase-like NAD-dependent aldehyde dehydrogenase
LNPFLDTAFQRSLQAQQIHRLVIAGLELHDGVRAAALEARDRGYEVWVADEAVGTTEPEHAEMTRIYLESRECHLLDTATMLAKLGCGPQATPSSGAALLPVGHIAGRWLAAGSHRLAERRNPARWTEVLARVPMAEQPDVAEASQAARQAQRAWMRQTAAQRAAVVDQWARVLAARAEELAEVLTVEVGKPHADSRDEIRRAIGLAQSAARSFAAGEDAGRYSLPVTSVQVCSRPHGVVGIITPWNNPVAIPVGKLAPAIAAANGVVWKPATEAPRTAMLLFETLLEAGVPSGLANLVFGDATTARQVIDNRDVSAVTLTGAIETGRAALVRCARQGKPLQAELGGNNAAVVMRDCDVRSLARSLALAAFSFAGQRCTRIQRFVVEQAIVDEFQKALVAATETLRLGDPRDAAVDLGPLISQGHRDNVLGLLRSAVRDGAQILCGGYIPEALGEGCWLMPAVVSSAAPRSRIAQEEIFGPVAVVLPAADLTHAIALANDVEHGLLAALYTSDPAHHAQFREAVEAGIVKLTAGPLDVHPDAPFGGWKASRVGPPEHGEWDREFYLRVQAVYGNQRGGDAC